MRKLTVWGVAALLTAGLAASPAAAAFAAPAAVAPAAVAPAPAAAPLVATTVGQAQEPASPAGEAGVPPTSQEPGTLAETGASSAIGFALITIALVGGGATLVVLRRKGALEG